MALNLVWSPYRIDAFKIYFNIKKFWHFIRLFNYSSWCIWQCTFHKEASLGIPSIMVWIAVGLRDVWSWKYNRRVLSVVVRGVGDILTVSSNDVPPWDTTVWHMRSNRLRILLKHLNILLWLGLNGFYIKTYKEILIAEVVKSIYVCLLVL